MLFSFSLAIGRNVPNAFIRVDIYSRNSPFVLGAFFLRLKAIPPPHLSLSILVRFVFVFRNVFLVGGRSVFTAFIKVDINSLRLHVLLRFGVSRVATAAFPLCLY